MAANGQDVTSSETGATGSGTTRKRGPTRAASAYQTARSRTYSALDATRDRATRVTRQAIDQASVYPVAAVLGGLAVGAVLAALVPATRRERELLGSTGRKLTDAARDVAQRGVDLAKDQVDEVRDRAFQKVGEAVVDVVGATKD